MASPQAVSGGGGTLCGRCRQGKYKFDLARSYGVYSGNLRRAILQLKFQGRMGLGPRLGGLLTRGWDCLPETTSALVIPVPLHSVRRRERGFNQAEVLAKGLLRKLRKQGKCEGVRYLPNALRRTRATAPQVGLSEAARRENVRGVFSVERTGDVCNRTVVIVDDVMTTGATLSACAAALKRAGAEQVLALSLARATPQFPDITAAPEADVDLDGFGHDST